MQDKTDRKFSRYSGADLIRRTHIDLLTVKFVTDFSKRSIHLFGSVGLFSGFCGFLLLVYLLCDKFMYGINMGNRPLMSLGIMLMMVDAQFLLFGLLTEMTVRTYYESQDKKTYDIRNMREFHDEATTFPPHRAA